MICPAPTAWTHVSPLLYHDRYNVKRDEGEHQSQCLSMRTTQHMPRELSHHNAVVPHLEYHHRVRECRSKLPLMPTHAAGGSRPDDRGSPQTRGSWLTGLLPQLLPNSRLIGRKPTTVTHPRLASISSRRTASLRARSAPSGKHVSASTRSSALVSHWVTATEATELRKNIPYSSGISKAVLCVTRCARQKWKNSGSMI